MGVHARDEGFALYQRRVKSIPTLSMEEESGLAEAHRRGDRRAGERLIESNLKYVITIAQEYRRWGIPLDDLVQQGNIGLLKAAERFDPAQKTALRTYAAYWIRAEIRDHVVRGYRIVRLGTTRTERRAIRAFRSTPVDSPEALAEQSGMPEARCRMLWPLLVRGDRSLDHSVAGSTPPRELLASAVADPETQLAARQQREHDEARVSSALSRLDDREQSIVRARMMEEEQVTLEQLGRQMGVSRERVRQLETRAKDKIRDLVA
jgi:RNA polymerase sigma-32 factor